MEFDCFNNVIREAIYSCAYKLYLAKARIQNFVASMSEHFNRIIESKLRSKFSNEVESFANTKFYQ